MKTFFTEVDPTLDQLAVKEIQKLQMKLNFDSPRTQSIMKRIGVNKKQCLLMNPSDFKEGFGKGYQQHIEQLKNILSQIVDERRLQISSVDSKYKKINISSKVFNHDLKELYKSELQIKEMQSKNNDRIHRTIENKLQQITMRAKKHNEKVYFKLNSVRRREVNDLEDRMTKSMDFGSKFFPIEEKLNQTKQQFVQSKHTKTVQSITEHRKKRELILQKQENQRVKLKEQLDKLQKNSMVRYFGFGSQDKLSEANRITQESELRLIQKVGSSAEKCIININKAQQQLQQNLQRVKGEEEKKLNRVSKLKQNANFVQSLKEANLYESLQEKLHQSESKAKQRLADLQSKMKSAAAMKQSKQQDLLNKIVIKMESKKEKILSKHNSIKSNLKLRNESTPSLIAQKSIIQKDGHYQEILRQQRSIVTLSPQNIQQLLESIQD